eukprot:14393680-Alexandrium_andersonii.AAC.1
MGMRDHRSQTAARRLRSAIAHLISSWMPLFKPVPCLVERQEDLEERRLIEGAPYTARTVSYTHLRAHETSAHL